MTGTEKAPLLFIMGVNKIRHFQRDLPFYPLPNENDDGGVVMFSHDHCLFRCDRRRSRWIESFPTPTLVINHTGNRPKYNKQVQ